MKRNERNKYRDRAEEERQMREDALDQTLADSFPTSDPPSAIPNPAGETAAREGNSEKTDTET